jgi:8-oxo-dGTP pyrophosphatase MutT (NUDIX family)
VDDESPWARQLLADGRPEQEFVPGIAARLPRKRVAAGALVRDDLGRILFVEPVYKPTWDMPGGVVEADEPPLAGCRRELREELGIDLPVTRLLVVDWVPQQGPWHDALLFVFDAGVLPPGALDAVVLPPDELRAVHLATLDDAAEHVPPALARRLRAAVEVANDDSGTGPRYLQLGEPAL